MSSCLPRDIATVWCSQCSAVYYSAVQCSVVHCSTVQCSVVQCSAVQNCGTVSCMYWFCCRAVPCLTRESICTALQCPALDCTTLHYVFRSIVALHSFRQCIATNWIALHWTSLNCHTLKFLNFIVHCTPLKCSSNVIHIRISILWLRKDSEPILLISHAISQARFNFILVYRQI